MKTSLRLIAALTAVASFTAFADPRSTSRRHAEVEESLKHYEQKRQMGNAVIGVGVVSLGVAAAAVATGIGTEMGNVGKTAASLASVVPAAATGTQAYSPKYDDSSAAFTTAAVTGVLGAVLTVAGLVGREAAAPMKQKTQLVLEKDQLESHERFEATRRAEEAKAVLAEPSPNLVPQPVVTEPAPEAPRRKPLVPAVVPADAPTAN